MPRDAAKPPSLVALSCEPLAGTRDEGHVVRRARGTRAAAARAHDAVVPEHDRASVVVGARTADERHRLHAPKSFRGLGRFQLAPVTEEDAGSDRPRIVARRALHLLRPEEASMAREHPLHDVDLRVLQAPVSPLARYGHAVRPRRLDDGVPARAREVRVVEDHLTAPRGEMRLERGEQPAQTAAGPATIQSLLALGHELRGGTPLARARRPPPQNAG